MQRLQVRNLWLIQRIIDYFQVVWRCIHQYVFLFRSSKLQEWNQKGAESPGGWKLQPGASIPDEASQLDGEKPSVPHRFHSGTTAGSGAQFSEVPLPVCPGAAHHCLGPPPIRDSCQDLVSEQAHQVEEGASATEGGRGAAYLHIIAVTRCGLCTSVLQSSVLPSTHSTPALYATAADAL